MKFWKNKQEIEVVDVNAEQLTPIPIQIGFAVLATMFLPHYSLLGITIGAILPDCDKKNSPFWKFFPFWLIFKPNGFTHSIASLYLVGSLSYFLFGNADMSLGISCGYLSHLVFDFIRGQDCQFLYPRKDSFSLKAIKLPIKQLIFQIKCKLLTITKLIMARGKRVA